MFGSQEQRNPGYQCNPRLQKLHRVQLRRRRKKFHWSLKDCLFRSRRSECPASATMRQGHSAGDRTARLPSASTARRQTRARRFSKSETSRSFLFSYFRIGYFAKPEAEE